MKKTIAPVFIVICISLSATATQAQEVIDVERIVVTSSRTPQEVRQATQAITIISQKEIASSNAQTIPELLKTTAGISVRDYSGTGKQVNVDMRGFGETGPSNMLVMIDGRRVNAIDLSNTDWSQISLSQIDHIEIARGASSVLYGDNAAAGIVHIITKKGEGRPSISFEQKGGSENTCATTVASSGATAKTSYRFSGERFETQGYRENGSLLRHDVGLQIGHAFDPTLETKWTFGYHEDEYGLPGALREDEILARGRRATKYPQDSASATDWFHQIEIDRDLEENGKLQTNFSVRTRTVDSTYVSSGWRNENYILTIGATPKYTLNSLIGDKENTLLAGFDLYYVRDNILDGAISGSNDNIRIAKNSQGFYLQDQLQILPRISLKAGFRREAAQYNFRQLGQFELKETSRLADEVYQVGGVYLWSDASQIFINYGTSFRYPLVDEFFSSYNPLWGVGGLNTSLSTQTGRDLEVGWRHTPSARTHLNLTFFRSDIKNEIYLNADPMVYANTNYDKTLHQGVEIEGGLKISDKIRGLVHYTFTSAVFGEGPYDGNRIPGVPEHKASAGITVEPCARLRLNFAINYVGSMHLISDQANEYPKVDEYATVDMRLNYAWADAELFWGVNNIFDAEYAAYGILSTFSGTRNFYPSPGRHVIAGIRYKF